MKQRGDKFAFLRNTDRSNPLIYIVIFSMIATLLGIIFNPLLAFLLYIGGFTILLFMAIFYIMLKKMH